MLDEVSEFRLEPFFDALDVGTIVLDGQRCVVGWNDWMARVTGRSKWSVSGKNLFDIFTTLRDTRLPTVIEDSFQVGSSSILTHSLNKLLPLRGEDGQELFHNIVVRPISSGRTNFCLLQINDVTVAVSRERVLRERQNARYHAIVDSAPDAIITIDDNRNIQWVNGAVEHVLGYSHAELLGQKLDVLLDPDNPLLQTLAQTSVNSKVDNAISVVGR